MSENPSDRLSEHYRKTTPGKPSRFGSGAKAEPIQEGWEDFMPVRRGIRDLYLSRVTDPGTDAHGFLANILDVVQHLEKGRPKIAAGILKEMAEHIRIMESSKSS